MTSFSKLLWISALVVLTILSVMELSANHPSKKQKASQIAAEDVSNAAGPMMLELYTPYCPSCRQMAPLMERLAKSCPQKGVAVVQYDISVSENEHFINELGIDAVPTFVFIDAAGQEAGRLVGSQTAETLHAHLAGIGGEECTDRT
jgi:thiol:disulfide interchange protein